MKQTLLLRFVVIAMMGFTAQLNAAPLGYKNSWMVMGDFSKTYQELSVNYSTTANDALGVSVSAMQTDDSVSKQQNAEVAYTRKLARWNLPNAQANIWFIGGLGSTTGNTFGGSKAMASPGLQVDYETTRFYSMASARVYAAQGATSNITTARLGASFYEVDYHEKCLRTYSFFVRGNIPERVGLLLPRMWQSNIHDMLGGIPSISSEGLDAYFRSIDSKLSVYDKLKDAPKLLELAIWKSKIIERTDRNTDLLDADMKIECRTDSLSMVAIIVPNVLSFLE